jgi:hypothetical protein
MRRFNEMMIDANRSYQLTIQSTANKGKGAKHRAIFASPLKIRPPHINSTVALYQAF